MGGFPIIIGMDPTFLLEPPKKTKAKKQKLTGIEIYIPNYHYGVTMLQNDITYVTCAFISYYFVFMIPYIDFIHLHLVLSLIH